MSKLTDEIQQRKHASFMALANKREAWDEYEDIFTSKLSDSVSDTTKSQVFDPRLSTLAIERSNRVMAQLPTGKIRGVSKNDEGGEKLMNLVMDKYVLPNANAQFDFLTKMRMVDLYSNIYGNFFTFVDWDVRKNGYTGPDVWLLNIRDVFHQVGAVSLEDSDYVVVRTWRPLSFFENLKKGDGYKNVPAIIKNLKDKTGDKTGRSSDEKSRREDSEYPDSQEANRKGFFEVLSMYEKDRWVDMVPDADMVFRDQANPHENDELPVVCKYSIPLIDDFMGMGDFERGKSLQYTLNSVWNLYLDAVKLSIFPPTLINKDSVASSSSIKFSAAAKWLMRGNLDNAAKVLNLTPQGINTFNNTQGAVISALLNTFGTTDTSVTAETDPAFGKTPQALKMQNARESTRDNADRFYMEQYMKKVMNRMVNLIGKNQKESMQIRLFKDEIEELTQQYPEMEEMYNEKSGKFSIPKGRVNMVYDYEIVSGSTYAVDQKEQQQNLVSMMEMYLTNPELIEQKFQAEQKEFKLGELMTRVISNSGIQDWDKIIVDMNEGGNEEQNDQQVVQQAEEQFMQGLQQIMGSPQQASQVPPQPQGMPQQAPQGPPQI